MYYLFSYYLSFYFFRSKDNPFFGCTIAGSNTRDMLKWLGVMLCSEYPRGVIAPARLLLEWTLNWWKVYKRLIFDFTLMYQVVIRGNMIRNNFIFVIKYIEIMVSLLIRILGMINFEKAITIMTYICLRICKMYI